jgi:hypothetical protein
MNIKQFLVIYICDQLPSDIICKIWEHVKHSSADSIRNLYNFKVQRNMDIFFILKNLDNTSNSCEHVNNIINFYSKKITYPYIHGNKTWLNLLFDIIEEYSHEGSHDHFIPVTFIDKKLHVNNIYSIMNHICRGYYAVH